MDFMDSSFHTKTEAGKMFIGHFQDTSESSDFELSGGFTAVPPPFQNAYCGDTLIQAPRFPLSLQNVESFPCTSLSLMQKRDSMEAMRETIFRMAMMQPVHIDPESVKPPRRKNVRISKDPQSVAARHRRERISQRIRTLQRMVPGGAKLDTASMLDEAVHYLKFLKKQVQLLEQAAESNRRIINGCWNISVNYANA